MIKLHAKTAACSFATCLALIVFLACGPAVIGIQALISLGVGHTSAWTDMHVLVGTSNKTSIQYFRALIVANAGNVGFSIIRFSYEGVLASVCGALEWEAFAMRPRSLRVSGKPKGEQRSRYFMNLPYRFAVPLLVLCGVMHWLLSQSFFATLVQMFEFDYKEGKWVLSSAVPPYTTCNFSPLGIVLVAALLGLKGSALLGVSVMWSKTDMPLSANCSAVISAACHPRDGENGSCFRKEKLKWGVLGYDDSGVGRCGFSAGHVTALEDELSYM